MYRVFIEQGHYRWLKVLPELVKEYNDTIHSSIDMKPQQVDETKERMVLERIRKKHTRRVVKERKFKVRHRVGISKQNRDCKRLQTRLSERYIHRGQSTTYGTRYLCVKSSYG